MKLKVKILIGFISAFLLTVIIGYLSYTSAEVTISDNLARRNNNNFIKKLKQLSGDFYKIEALESYYVLTNDTQYLNGLISENPKLMYDLNDLNESKKDVITNGELNQMFEKIIEHVNKEIKENEEHINVFNKNDPVLSKNAFDISTNYLSMIKLNESIGTLETSLEKIRLAYNDKSIIEANETKIIIPVGSIITFLILIVAYLFIKLDISGREKAEKELRELNEKLETKVIDRTYHLNDLNKVLESKIEEQKQSEILLKQSEEKYRSLFENMSEGYEYCQMLYMDGRPYDWIIVSANKSFEKLMGLKNVTGKRVSELIPGIHKTDPRLLEINSKVASTGKPEKFEIFVEAQKAWFSVSLLCPQKGYFVNIFEVITERKLIENALKKSEEQYRGLF